MIDIISIVEAALFVDAEELPRSLRALARVDGGGNFGLWIDFTYNVDEPDPNVGYQFPFAYVEQVLEGEGIAADLLDVLVRTGVDGEAIINEIIAKADREVG